MPEWKVHFKWEEKLLGRKFPEIEELIDFPDKLSLDSACIDRAFEMCKDNMIGLNVSKSVENILGINNVQLTENLYKEYIYHKLSTHDIYRNSTELLCPLLMYVYCKHGKEGFKAAVLHMLLDEMAKYNRANILVAQEQLYLLITMLRYRLPPRQYELVEQVYGKVSQYLKEMYRDIIGSPPASIVKAYILYDQETADRELLDKLVHLLISRGINVDVLPIHRLSRDSVKKYVRLIRDIAYESRVSYHNRRSRYRLIYYDDSEDKLHVFGGILLIFEMSDDRKVFYPHYITFGKEKIIIRIDDLIRLLERDPL